MGEHSPNPRPCDLDLNGQVDRNDIGIVVAPRNMPAAPGDPRDADGNGVINVNDARICTPRLYEAGVCTVMQAGQTEE